MSAARVPASELGLTWHPISDDLVDTWLGLMVAIEAHDNCSERQDRDDLIETLHDGPYKDPARDSLLGVDEAGMARAFGVVIPLPGDTLRRVYLWGGVHPERRGRGIGRELLRWQTERAHEALAEQQNGADPASAVKPWRIGVSLETNHPDPGALYEAAGYTAVRWFHEMIRPFGAGAPAIPDVVPPDGLILTHWREDLDSAVRVAHNEAFAHHWGSQSRDEEFWRTSVTEHRTFRRDWSRVVLDPTQPDSAGRPSVAALGLYEGMGFRTSTSHVMWAIESADAAGL